MFKDIIDANKNVDSSEIKIKQLKDIFPGAFHGETVDLEYIKNQLMNIKTSKEGYELNFLGKSYAKLLAALETETVVSPNAEHNLKEENRNSNNIYISADNLDALKHLTKSYWHKVKMIYIDPPYNTGSDGFVYNDSFKFSKEFLADRLGLSDEDASRIIDMTNSGSSSHSAWLTFMYPRLYLAKQLLKDDGVIFISIDDNENANLRLICDDIFGENNFIANIIWQKKFSRSNDATYFSTMHDHILCYTKNSRLDSDYGWNIGLEQRKSSNPKGYSNPDNDPRGLWTSVILSAKSGNEKLIYEITGPNGEKHLPPSGRYWSVSEQEFSKLVAENRIWFGVKGDSSPRKKTFLSEVQQGLRPNTIWFQEDVGNNQEGKQELKRIFDGIGVFDSPKPTRLIKYMLQIANLEDGDIVLDFFGGSSSTGDAVLQFNSEADIKINYIIVQMSELVKENSEAFKNGYKTIDEIGVERLCRVGNQLKNELIETNKLSGFFPEYTTEPTSMDFGFKHYIVKNPSSTQLSQLDKFKSSVLFTDRGILDQFGINTVLTTWKNFDGYGLTKEWVELKLKDYTAYKIDGTIYLLNPEIPNNAIKVLLEKYEDDSFYCNKIVMFGYSFTMSEIQSIKDNLKQVESIRHITLDIIVRY